MERLVRVFRKEGKRMGVTERGKEIVLGKPSPKTIEYISQANFERQYSTLLISILPGYFYLDRDLATRKDDGRKVQPYTFYRGI